MNYIVITTSEDGDVRVKQYTKEELEIVLSRGEIEFSAKIPDADPMYWEGYGIIIRGDIVTPTVTVESQKIELP